ncbi:MAG TPA: hypothetical protein VHZ09_15345 [Acidobacteriaceae bacterium]|nr:hypothetical protein [Acidobacteriaceae bacterium]
MRAPDNIMTCAEFQETLPELFETQSELGDHEHLKTCENCAALVRDLEYIASQARLLLPIHDPSPAVWDNIQQALREEKPGSAPAARK